MNKKITLFLTLITVIFSAGIFEAYGFARHIYEIDNSGFPIIKAHLIAANMDGDDLDLKPEDFEVTDNGESRTETITIDKSKKPDTPSVSVLLVLDVSTSLSENNKFEMMKNGVKAFADSLKWKPGTRVGVVTFVNQSKNPPVHGGFQTDPQKIHEIMGRIDIEQGRTNHLSAIQGPHINIIEYLKTAPANQPRHVIFVTDGQPENPVLDISTARQLAEQMEENKIIFHTLIIEKNSFPLSLISANTGGKYLDRIALNQEEITNWFQYFAGFFQDLEYYQLVWEAPYGCDEASRNRNVEIKWWNKNHTNIEKTINGNYEAPESSIAKFGTDNEVIFYGEKESEHVSKNVTMNYRGPDMTVNGLNFSSSDDFYITDWGGSSPPFEMKTGHKRTLTVAYTEKYDPTESEEVTMTFEQEGYPCTEPEVTLISLCNASTAEDVVVDTVMQWLTETFEIDCAFENHTPVEMPIEVTIKGQHASDFELTAGGGSQMVPANGCLDIEIEFTPAELGIRNAEIEFAAPDACGGLYSLAVEGEGIVNSVKDAGYSNDGISIMTIEPNPAADDFAIGLEMNDPKEVLVEMYNSVGNKIRTLVDKNYLDGNFRQRFSLSDLPSGIYLIRLQSGNHFETKRLIITK